MANINQNLNIENQEASGTSPMRWNMMRNILLMLQAIRDWINISTSSTDTTLYSGTVDLNTTADQPVALAGGDNFMELNIILFLPTVSITAAKNLQIWSGAGKTGVQYYSSAVGTEGLQKLVLNSEISFAHGNIGWGSGAKDYTPLIPRILYISLDTAQGVDCSASIVINGIKVN